MGPVQELKVNDLEGDESLYREMHRFGLYFSGAMGAEAIQKRLIDFDSKAKPRSCANSSPPAGQRKTRALKRLVVNVFLTTDNNRRAWSSTPFR